MTTNDRAIVGLTTVTHALVHTYELSVPILMTIWLDEFATGPAELGAVVATGYALYGLGALPGGLLADRLGSHRLIAVCLAGMGGAFLLLSLAQSLLALGGALVLWGAAASLYHPSGLSLISTGVTQRGRALAVHGMGGNAGTALGPLVTTLLLIGLSWRWTAALLALPALGAVLYALRTSFDAHAAVDDGRPSPEDEPADAGSWWRTTLRISRHLFASGFAAVFAIVMLTGLYYRGTLTFLPDLLSGMVAFEAPTLGAVPLEPGRYFYVGLLAVGILGQYAGGRLTDRFRTEQAMTAVLLVLAATAAAFLPLGRLGTVPLLAVSAVLGFFLFAVQPLYQATVAEYTPADARGLSYGYTYLGVFGVGALGAALAGALLDAYSADVAFAVLGGLAACAAVLAAVLARHAAGSADAPIRDA